MKVVTRISHVTREREMVRGRELAGLIGDRGFAETAWFVLRGSFPTPERLKLFEAALVAAVDHGAAPASSIATRVVASAGNDVRVALAAGLLAQGDLHGGAIEGAARFLAAHAATGEDPVALLAAEKAAGRKIPGYGHRILATDRRSVALLGLARSLGLHGPHCELAARLEKVLEGTASKPVPLNIDGAMAAVLLDLGFSPDHLRGLFALARLPGLLAQAVEETATGGGPRRLAEDEIEYVGPAAS